MRALVAIRPFYGHLHPVVPLASALIEAGHEVAFATERSFCPVVERCGFRTFPAGLDPFAPVEVGYEFSEPVTRQKAQDVLDIAGAWPFDLILRGGDGLFDAADLEVEVSETILHVGGVGVGGEGEFVLLDGLGGVVGAAGVDGHILIEMGEAVVIVGCGAIRGGGSRGLERHDRGLLLRVGTGRSKEENDRR